MMILIDYDEWQRSWKLDEQRQEATQRLVEMIPLMYILECL